MAHQATERRAAAGARGRPREGAHDPEGHGRRDRAGREVQHLGVRRARRAGACRPRARGPDGRDDAHERRRDPALDRLPRRARSPRTSRSATSRRASRSRSSFRANDPGVFMYHCGTKPVLAHIANGMYGAIVVDPATPLPKADHEYVLVGERVVPERRRRRRARIARHGRRHARDAAGLDDVQRLREPVRHASADRGPRRDRTRSTSSPPARRSTSNFHVVGTILDRAWVNGDMTTSSSGACRRSSCPPAAARSST